MSNVPNYQTLHCLRSGRGDCAYQLTQGTWIRPHFGEVLKELHKKAIILLTVLYNSMLRLSYYPLLWKFAHHNGTKIWQTHQLRHLIDLLTSFLSLRRFLKNTY